MLTHFGIDPILFGVLVALNLQTAFLSPPMAMSAYYLKGVSPPSLLLTQIFSGCMPFVYVVLVTMLLIYIFPRHRAVAAQCPVRPLTHDAARSGCPRSDAAQGIRDGLFDAEQLVQACLERIRQTEGQVQAWQHLDESHALVQARARDADRREGRAIGPLHGVPVGLKDIIDTVDMPTEDGTVLHAGRLPGADAAVVARLRSAGAVILGKTVTTELATYAAGKTRNPHDPSRTPGGSSSGSAAAVAAGMVPLALGTQTNGSVIRPAAFCGVYGYKPSAGLVSRHGILKTSRTLDCVGWFARTLDDVALLAEALCGHDERDLDTRPMACPPFLRLLAEEPPLPPRLALVKTPMWDQADADTHEALAEVAEVLGAQCEEIRPRRIGARGLGLAPHDHGGRDGLQPRAGMDPRPRPAVAVAAAATAAWPRAQCAATTSRRWPAYRS